MAYTNNATERARLRQQLIEVESRACNRPDCPTPFDRRELHRIHNGCNGGQYTLQNTEVLCFNHHKLEHPNSKFRIGDKVRLRNNGDLKHSIPAWLCFTDYEKARPRTIVGIEYSQKDRCNYYTLGSNARGQHFAKNGQPLDGFSEYKFRSYQLVAYTPRRYHYKRKYTRKSLSGITTPPNQNPGFSSPTLLRMPTSQTCYQSQEIVSNK